MDAREVAARFGLGRPVRLSDGPVARGRQGVVWRLDTVEGPWAVKVAFERGTEAEVAASTQLQETAFAAGVPTPPVRRALDGAVLADVGADQVRVYGWVGLLDPDVRLDPELVGTVVAGVHLAGAVLPAPDGPVEAWYTDPVGAGAWDELVARLRAEGAPFAEALAGLRDELVALEAWIEPQAPRQLCHRDLWADNLLPTVDGGVCLVDWENAGAGDPSQELGCVLFEFARGDAGRARALTAAYDGAGGPGAVTAPGHFSMLVAQLGHITRIAAEDWLEPNTRSPDRAGSAAWIGEVLDDPHSRAVLTDLLDAVR